MNPAVLEAHQIFTLQGYFQLLSERVQQEQMEMHVVSKRIDATLNSICRFVIFS